MEFYDLLGEELHSPQLRAFLSNSCVVSRAGTAAVASRVIHGFLVNFVNILPKIILVHL